MDSFFVKAIGQELRSKIMGGQIGKPWLGDPFHLILPLSSPDRKAYLYYSCLPSLPILYLTEEKPPLTGKGPEQTELLFRKYLTGAFITEVQIIDMERIIILHMQRDIHHQDFLPEYPKMRLIFEIMGRYGNSILASDQDRILAALRYVPGYKNQRRQILLGAGYQFPPASKIHPRDFNRTLFYELQKSFDRTISNDRFLQQKIAGLDPALAAEICYRAEKMEKMYGHKDALWRAFSEILSLYHRGAFSPRITYPDRDTVRLCPFFFEQFAQRRLPDKVFPCASEAAEYFEKQQRKQNNFKSLQNLLLHTIRQNLTKAKNRQTALVSDQQKADRAEEYREEADIIMANMSRMKKGQDYFEAENFYSSRKPAPIISIPLNPQLTPAQNAQQYYKRYTKAKKSLAIIKQRREENTRTIAFLASLQRDVTKENQLSGLEKYKRFLKEKKIIPPPTVPLSSSRSTAPRSLSKDIRRYISVNGFEILVGKNDRGNDALTCKIARKDDLWLHAQDMPGSHVLIRNPKRLDQIPLPTLRQAASLAACFSKARKDTKIMVDYTFAKYVVKPKGAKAGLVLVKQKKSILVSSEVKNVLS